MKKFSSILILCLLSILIGCSETNKPNEPDKIDIDELIKAPTKIEIGSTSFTLSMYVWRDFMPISPPDGRLMQAVIHINTSDSSDFPANINADKLWLLDTANVWEAALIDDYPSDSIFQLSKRAIDGPKWQTGITVDGVIRLVQDDSIFYYVKAENVVIHRTD